MKYLKGGQKNLVTTILAFVKIQWSNLKNKLISTQTSKPIVSKWSRQALILTHDDKINIFSSWLWFISHKCVIVLFSNALARFLFKVIMSLSIIIFIYWKFPITKKSNEFFFTIIENSWQLFKWKYSFLKCGFLLFERTLNRKKC